MMLAVVVALAPLSLGHIQLDEPLVRYPNSPREVNKSCPCGAGAGDDHCQNGVLDDLGGRNADRVTTFRAGETVTVRWRETVGHTGRYRISFSADGATQAQFNAHPLRDDIVDTSGASGNTGDGNHWEATITVPDTPCDNCVLQLIQDMGNRTAEPVGDLPNGHDLYFQCADIVILANGEGEGEGEGDVGEGEGEGDVVGEGEGDEGEGEGEEGEGDEGEGDEGEGDEGEGEEGEGEGEEGEGDDDSVDGCDGCAATSTSAPLFGLGLLLFWRRRRR